MLESKIIIFEGNQKDGIFSSNRKFYEKNITEEEIESKMIASRKNLAKKNNFLYNKMLQVTQKMEDNDEYENNKYVLIDESYMQKDDYMKEVIKADILIIKEQYKKIVLCHRTGDCPVLIAEDREKGISAIAHCGIYHINRELPKELICTMIREFKCNVQNIYLYIGSHIKKDSYLYDNYPQKLNNKKVWKNAIKKIGDKYSIDMEKAIRNQLRDFQIREIKVSNIDTATTKDYASHYMAEKGHKDKLGQNIVGFYYK